MDRKKFIKSQHQILSNNKFLREIFCHYKPLSHAQCSATGVYLAEGLFIQLGNWLILGVKSTIYDINS